MKKINKSFWRSATIFLFVNHLSCSKEHKAYQAASNPAALISHFECKNQGNGRFRPYYMQAINGGSAYKDWSQTAKGLLGQNAMISVEECQRALTNANSEFGVICSRTGLDGWKPTIYTGTTPGRADFGYLGGSSINRYEDCLAATKKSSHKGVCFWGGSAWYVSPIDHEGVAAGGFGSIDECVAYTAIAEAFL